MHEEITSVPQFFALKTIVSVGDDVRDSVKRWGGHLLDWYSKPRAPAGTARDPTLQYLGFSTDNGAYYYYTTEQGKTYQEALTDVEAYSDREGIPYRYILLDSWWYFQGPSKGLIKWEPMPQPPPTPTPDPNHQMGADAASVPFIKWEPMPQVFPSSNGSRCRNCFLHQMGADAAICVFPDGLNAFFNSTGWLVQAHNRYWSTKNVYATQNGGGWPFDINESGGAAVPLLVEFCNSFFRNASALIGGLGTYEQALTLTLTLTLIGGLWVYEQDWLDIEVLKASSHASDMHLTCI